MNNHFGMPDEKLIQFYLSGDPNAMATLIELYKDRVYGSIYAMVQDRYVAEEIFHNVFINIINNMIAGKTAEEGNFLEWAIRIAQKLCMEHSERTKHGVVVTAGAYANTENASDFSVPAALPKTGYHENHGKIKNMIDMLPDVQREVVVLNHYGGLSFKEIADIMKCSLNTALDTMRFGLNNLQKLMTEKEIAVR